MRVTARAHANIALVKYWGKRDAALNLPAAGSLSLTLEALATETTVAFDASLADDAVVLDNRPLLGDAAARTSAWLDLVRARAGIDTRARVDSRNNFPTASGLASSASGFAALAVAASAAAGLELEPAELSALARRGSGSAARSIFGGLVRMHAGDREDGADAIATPILDSQGAGLASWLRMVVAVVGGGAPKSIGSRDAMEHCAETSPYYRAWIDTVDRDLPTAEEAIAARDVAALGAVMEANALAMHAAAIASRPAVLYWQPATLAALAAIAECRAQGLDAWATIDAGPHVKALTTAEEADDVATRLRAIPGVDRVVVSAAGGPALITRRG
jgi:diphosphomevalonate decarboxylase